MEGKIKKKRGENWSQEDKELLQQLVKEKFSVIENKRTDTNTSQGKLKAWSEIEESFNQISSAPRTAAQLKCQWKIQKIAARKDTSSHKKEVFKTGGGQPPVDVGVSGSDIRAWLPNEFVVDYNDFDSDKHLQEEQSQKAEKFFSENYLEDSLNELLTNTIEVEIETLATTNNNNEAVPTEIKTATEATKKEQKKKHSALDVAAKKSKTTSNDKIEAVADHEMKCRAELHELQTQVEREKLKNLKLEHEVLLEKLKFYKKKNEDIIHIA